MGISWHPFDFTPKRSKEGENHLGWPPYFTNRDQTTAGHFGGVGSSLKFLGLVKGFCRKWTPLPRKSVDNTKHSTVVWFFWDLSEWRIFPNPQLWLLDQIYEGSYWTKQRSESQVTSQTQGCEMLYFWHTLLHCFNTVSLSVKVQYSSWMLLAVRGDVEVENEDSFCWQERISVLSSTSKLLCLSFNHWISPNLTSAHADCILFRPLKLGWSTQVCARHPQSRGRYLRPACNSHPFRSDAKVQLNLPGYRAKNSGSLLEINCSLTHLFVLPSTSQLLSPECHSHDSPCSAHCPKNKNKSKICCV